MEKKVEICYDGNCRFCESSMQWLRRNDQHDQFNYTTLPKGASHVILKDEEGTWKASTAALRAMGHVGGIWKILSKIFLMIPRPIRDGMYYIIARYRNHFTTRAQGVQNNAE
ncbi:MAG: DCC1-like thiol-disulfide oxidoreductase family protein [Bacteroidetes bacterium]|nr:DCC1-like thiol-disulfide oxidoreductase family protein [Bacteroidota bacterium]